MRRRRAVVTFTCLSAAAATGLGLAATGGVAGATPVNQSTGFYTVQPGDTLSAIAQAAGTNYEALAQINHIADPNVIVAGQLIILDATTAQLFTQWVDAASGGGQEAQQSAPAAAPATSPPPSQSSYSSSSSSSGYTGATSSSPGGIAACIRQAENGGSYQWGTGDGGGAYQFMPSTWSYVNSQDGGNPGNTSPSNQDAAFNWLYAHQGTAPWAGDACVG